MSSDLSSTSRACGCLDVDSVFCFFLKAFFNASFNELKITFRKPSNGNRQSSMTPVLVQGNPSDTVQQGALRPAGGDLSSMKVHLTFTGTAMSRGRIHLNETKVFFFYCAPLVYSELADQQMEENYATLILDRCLNQNVNLKRSALFSPTYSPNLLSPTWK